MGSQLVLNDLIEDSIFLLKSMIEGTSLGTVVLNDQKETVYLNPKMLSYFSGNSEMAYTYFENVFRCFASKRKDEFCLSYLDLVNCSFHKNIDMAFKNKQVICDVQTKHTIAIDSKFLTLWFDVCIIPFKSKGEWFVMMTFVDMSDLMKFKIESDKLHILNDEDNAIEKNRFHENVMASVAKNNVLKGDTFLILTELNDVHWIKENFGLMWKNEHLNSFYLHLIHLLGPKDFFCRYSENQFLTFFPNEKEGKVKTFIKKLNVYNDEYFQTQNALSHKVMKLVVENETVKRVVDENRLYKEYFKAIAMIENIQEDEIYEMVFK